MNHSAVIEWCKKLRGCSTSELLTLELYLVFWLVATLAVVWIHVAWEQKRVAKRNLQLLLD